MVEVRCRPIDQWHGPTTEPWARRRPQYGAGWARTLDDLERELDALEATDVSIGIELLPGDIRLDGWPRARAPTPPPPVSITFGSKYGPKRFECDRFIDWRQNVRAIGVTLQRLRLVDEGGCTGSGEQYVGFGALPPGQATALGDAMTIEEAARLLAEHGGPWSDPANPPKDTVAAVAARLLDPDTAGAVTGLFRNAAKRHHPDAGGDPALFRRLNEARDLLQAARR